MDWEQVSIVVYLYSCIVVVRIQEELNVDATLYRMRYSGLQYANRMGH